MSRKIATVFTRELPNAGEGKGGMIMSYTNTNCLSSLSSLNRFKIPVQFKRNNVKVVAVSARLDGDSQSSPANPQVNLSVLRFTLGVVALSSLCLSNLYCINAMCIYSVNYKHVTFALVRLMGYWGCRDTWA